jgi:lipopolysaccharide transport system ATP-binding protein
VRLRSLRIVDRDLVTQGTVDVRDSVGIEVTLDVLPTDAPPFVPWLALYNDRGDHIFSAMDTDPAWRESRAPGRYVSTAWIPGNFLNEGAIVVSVSMNTFASERSIRQAYVDGALTFHVVDHGAGGTARGHYGGTWPGPVRPLLEWATDFGAGDLAPVRTSQR